MLRKMIKSCLLQHCMQRPSFKFSTMLTRHPCAQTCSYDHLFSLLSLLPIQSLVPSKTSQTAVLKQPWALRCHLLVLCCLIATSLPDNKQCFWLGLWNTGCLALKSRIYALYVRNTRIYHKIHHVCEYVWNQQIQYEKQEVRSMERRIYMHVRVTNCIKLVHKYCILVWIKWVIAVLACLQG